MPEVVGAVTGEPVELLPGVCWIGYGTAEGKGDG